MTGRHKFRDPQVRARLLDAMRIGCYQVEAAAYAGIGVNTLTVWLRRGREELAAGNETGEYATFLREFEQAEADAVVRGLTVVQRAAINNDDWRAIMAWLGRRHPERWSERGAVQVQVEAIEPAEIELAAAIRQAKEQNAQRLAALRGDGSAPGQEGAAR